MSSANIGWLFYKDYFRGIDYDDIENERNKTTIQKKAAVIVAQKPAIVREEVLGNVHFEATTTYPGLILGSGNAHEIPGLEGQLILGFHFDYTTGLPVIPGSSVKGVLRSAFSHPEYIASLISSLEEARQIDIKALETEIFDHGDLFFDATVVGYGTSLLGDDFITPHKNIKGVKDDEGNVMSDALFNPIPLRFLKVMPGVNFMFDFLLQDGLLPREEKSRLFQMILSDLGLGAKTNVGYGKFSEFKRYVTEEERKEAQLREKQLRFERVMASEDLEMLETFKREHPDYLTVQVEEAIVRVKMQGEKSAIAKAYDNLDKKNPTHVKSFVEKYKNNPLANEFIELLQKGKKEKVEALVFNLEGLIKYKALEAFLKKYLQTSGALNEEQKQQLEAHLLGNMNDRIKRKKFPFGTIGNDKCLGREKANEIADKLGL